MSDTADDSQQPGPGPAPIDDMFGKDCHVRSEGDGKHVATASAQLLKAPPMPGLPPRQVVVLFCGWCGTPAFRTPE
jgi:hypothetical protein